MIAESKLTDTQLVLLSAAAQREDHRLVLPEKLKGGAAKAVVGKLIGLGLVAEIEVKPDPGAVVPPWRHDEETDRWFGLCITNAGLAAIGVECGNENGDEVCGQPPTVQSNEKEAPPDLAPSASKRDLLLTLLRKEGGAELSALTQATGWLPHTVRAALTRLRQRGHAVERAKNEEGCTIYRLMTEPSLPNAGQNEGEAP